MNDELAKQMREAASRATPGPWTAEDASHGTIVRAVASVAFCGQAWVAGEGESQSIDRKGAARNAAHIAATNPANVLALLDERDRLRAHVAELETQVAEFDRLGEGEYKPLDHAMQILGGCVADYTGEQAQAVAKVLKQWAAKWALMVDTSSYWAQKAEHLARTAPKEGT